MNQPNLLERQAPRVEAAEADLRAEPAPKARTVVANLGKRACGRIGVGLRTLLGRRTDDPLGILMHHRVAECGRGLPKPSYNVTPERFRRQLAGLLDRGFVAWPLLKVIEYQRSGKTIAPGAFVVTFDDGYESVYTNAWPILRELEVPATVFLSTAYLDADEPFPFDSWAAAHRAPATTWRPLTVKQCLAMARDGLVELGSHTHTHQDFRNRPEEFLRDMQTSVDVLRSVFAVREVTFAFPDGKPVAGYAAENLVQAARQAGAVCALTTEMVTVDPRGTPFQWGRFNVESWDTPATLDAKLSGWYGWTSKLKAGMPPAVQRVLN